MSGSITVSATSVTSRFNAGTAVAPKPTYAPEVLPGLAEAIDAGDREHLAAQVKRLAAALDHAAAILNMEPRITR